MHRCWAARSAASGKRKRPPAQRKIFGFHNPHYRFPDTELSGIRARTPRQNTDFVPGISDFWRSAAVSAPQAKILRFRTPKVSILASFEPPTGAAGGKFCGRPGGALCIGQTGGARPKSPFAVHWPAEGVARKMPFTLAYPGPRMYTPGIYDCTSVFLLKSRSERAGYARLLFGFGAVP